MNTYLDGLPEPFHALFGNGYLGYTAARPWGKVKGVDRWAEHRAEKWAPVFCLQRCDNKDALIHLAFVQFIVHMRTQGDHQWKSSATATRARTSNP